MACSLYAHGHLNLLRGHKHLGLRDERRMLEAHRTVGVVLSLSRPNLNAALRALHKHRSVRASIDVEAVGTGGLRQSYRVSVALTWR
jgi:hypothetical protein